TNVFPFVKSGGMSEDIPLGHLKSCAMRFTLPEIVIVSPKIVICLGLATFKSLMRAKGLKGSPLLSEAIDSPFDIDNSKVYCVGHTGALGMNKRGRSQVDSDWQLLAERISLSRRPR
ncbi:MAG: hypothetical protein O7F14_05310, partial [Alphaproteobacteria bacterium]|nr:hypothetical protein [Alphaproteobacteria bacterium]